MAQANQNNRSWMQMQNSLLRLVHSNRDDRAQAKKIVETAVNLLQTTLNTRMSSRKPGEVEASAFAMRLLEYLHLHQDGMNFWNFLQSNQELAQPVPENGQINSPANGISGSHEDASAESQENGSPVNTANAGQNHNGSAEATILPSRTKKTVYRTLQNPMERVLVFCHFVQ